MNKNITIRKAILKAIRDWQDQWNVSTPCNIFVDVDDTLILWKDSVSGHEIPWKANWDLCRFLRRLKHFSNVRIVVWSAGGKDHCDWAVSELGLKDVIDLTLDKPNICIDDISFATAFSKNFKPNILDKDQ